MEGVEGTPLVLDALEESKTLLVYCGSGEEEDVSPTEAQQRLQLSATFDLKPPITQENQEEALWLVGNTIQLGLHDGNNGSDQTVVLEGSEVVGDGTILEGETLLLLNDDVRLLPITQDVSTTDELKVNTTSKQIRGRTAWPKKYQPKMPNRTSHYSEESPKLSKLNLPIQTVPKTYSRASATTTPSSPSLSVSSSSSLPLTLEARQLSSVAESNTVLKHTSKCTGSSLSLPIKTEEITIKVEEIENVPSLPTHQEKGSRPSGVKFKLAACSKSSLDEDELSEEPFLGPSMRWPTQPKSYRGAKPRDGGILRKNVRKVPQRVDTDGETSGVGSSVDEPIESSTESASEAPVLTPSFIQPRPSSSRGPSTSPTAVKKRRGGWPKGRKRKPELPGAKPPKAPLTAYVLFLNERRKYYKETRPELSFGAVTKLLGAEWSAMTAEQKAAFVTRSEQDKRRYRNELQAYRQSHDYQLLLRKKRIKNVIRRGGTTTEESSDFTDEIDDDDSEELYCRICDQLFTSLHNKREHLYGKQHLQAITGEYQRERLAEEERQMAAAVVSGRGGDCLNCGSFVSSQMQCSRAGLSLLPPGVCPTCCSGGPVLPHAKQSPRPHDEEDDHDGDEEDEEEEEEEEEDDQDADEEGEVTEEEGVTSGMSSMADALEGVMAKMLEREQEIKALKQSSEDARGHNLQLATTLLQLREQEQQLDRDHESLQKENDQLKSEADSLWMLPALFGVTPLEMVNITLRHDQQQEATVALLDDT
ncbi:uncharacterized protein LOC121858724 isoform X2 [Homarus americanus]|uniref:uncharacterized protein LOC121858724 isoform X2 n=1 Tax=Homarus americanus TaxID=6706 RepID=UPI001C473D98|nr:uncharacterized protein LOC121858724 isoform X2 [Homarus americanus]